MEDKKYAILGFPTDPKIKDAIMATLRPGTAWPPDEWREHHPGICETCKCDMVIGPNGHMLKVNTPALELICPICIMAYSQVTGILPEPVVLNED